MQTQPLTDSAARDRARIAASLDYLGRHWRERPSLGELAARAGLSPSHFQRVFTRWTGISPARFVQLYALGGAKRRLAAGQSLLDAALDTGLSGPGRLHDLFVSLEAVTPGEFKRAGAGLELRWGVHPAPFGGVLLARSPRGITWLSFLDEPGVPGALGELRELWPGAELIRDESATSELVERVFDPQAERSQEPVPLHVHGTNFQVQVWRALLRIPPGSTTTYGELARALGRPRAARAVGGAVGSNPISVLIPCHRVLRAGGELGGYRWGLPVKRALLAWERGLRPVDGAQSGVE